MDPLAPTTSTLSPAISHIAETARSLAGSLQERSPSENAIPTTEREKADEVSKRKQQDTVSWVLGAPKRLQLMLNDGKRKEAETEWTEIENLLKAWRGTPGVQELTEHGLKIMGRDRLGDDT